LEGNFALRRVRIALERRHRNLQGSQRAVFVGSFRIEPLSELVEIREVETHEAPERLGLLPHVLPLEGQRIEAQRAIQLVEHRLRRREALAGLAFDQQRRGAALAEGARDFDIA
jgi:hypothetical protein